MTTKATLTIEFELPVGADLEAAVELLAPVISHMERGCLAESVDDANKHIAGAKHAVAVMVGAIWERANGKSNSDR